MLNRKTLIILIMLILILASGVQVLGKKSFPSRKYGVRNSAEKADISRRGIMN